MDVQTLTQIITNLGFPIACVVGMGFFIFKIYNDTTEQNETNMEQVQARCKEREDKLYQQLEKQNEINGKAIATIACYAEKLDCIQGDIRDIKADLDVIKEK